MAPFFFVGIVHFFLFVQKETNQRKRAPEKTTGSVFRQLRNAISPSKKQNPVRAFSGLALAHSKDLELL